MVPPPPQAPVYVPHPEPVLVFPCGDGESLTTAFTPSAPGPGIL